MSYSIDEGENVVNLVMVRYSDSSSELVVSVTLTDGSARGERTVEKERDWRGGRGEYEGW